MRAILLVGLLVSGCVTTPPPPPTPPKPFVGPSGNRAYSIVSVSAESAYREAGRLCSTGYTVISETERTEAVRRIGSMMVPLSRRNLVFECKQTTNK